MNSFQLYWRYIFISIRSQMEYRASFIILSLGQFIGTIIEFAGIWVLFNRFKQIQGWTLAEIMVLYGMINVSFALAEGFGRSFDTFHRMVKSGDFDRILLRPRSTVLQVFGQELALGRSGRLLQGLIILIWGVSLLSITWTVGKITLMMIAILGGACLFTGLFVFNAFIAFWTIEGLEIMNVTTYGGIETAQFPLSIYTPWLRWCFTLIIPLACANFFPAQVLFGRAAPGTTTILYWLSPLAGVLFLLIMLQGWKLGVRHYCSTGS